MLDVLMSDEFQAAGFKFLVAASALVPFLRKLASMTKTEADNRVVDFLDRLLSYVPRAKMGK